MTPDELTGKTTKARTCYSGGDYRSIRVRSTLVIVTVSPCLTRA